MKKVSGKTGVSTKLVHAARNPAEQGCMVNPPIYQTSTIVFPTYDDFLYAERAYSKTEFVKPYELKYGRYGTQTNFALEKAIAEIEGGYNTFVTSSGASAINTALVAFLKKGDHLLVVDNVYSPTRGFSDKFLTKFGVETTYFDSSCGAKISELIKPNTKVIFLEAPGSLSFEIQDFEPIIKIAKEKNIITIFDNSWASSVYFRPLEWGVDVSVTALTKYVNGHSDVLMGSITVQEKHFHVMYEAFRYMAPNAAPYNSYLVQRGLRTLKLRMDHSYAAALKMASWLEAHPMVEKVLYPALPSDENHTLWKKYFTGAAGIFSVIMKKKYDKEAMSRMLDNLSLYGMGYSWGGYESLIIPFDASSIRTATKWQYGDKTCFRINIGLEDVEDLQSDLAEGLKRLES